MTLVLCLHDRVPFIELGKEWLITLEGRKGTSDYRATLRHQSSLGTKWPGSMNLLNDDLGLYP